jgi:hypothetical protein
MALSKETITALTLVCGMLFFGTINTVMSKLQNSSYSIGIAGDIKKFSKPWFVVVLTTPWQVPNACDVFR